MKSAPRAVLAVLACAAVVHADAPSFLDDFNPFDFVPKECLSNPSNDDLAGCLQGRISTILDIGRSLLGGGVPHGNQVVSLDPLELPDVKDPANRDPKWRVSGIKISGLLDVKLESLRLAGNTVGVEVSFPSLVGQADLNFKALSFKPNIALEVNKPRMQLTADWVFTPQGGMRVSRVTPAFLNEGLSVRLRNVSTLTSWDPVWDEQE